MRKTLFLLVALATFCGVAGAADARTKPWRCQIKEGGTNSEWGQCMAKEVASQEARLNAAWKRLQPMLEPQSKIDLLAEQRAWIAYKEKSCRFYANGDFGREGQVLSWGSCRSGVVGGRADELEDLIDELKGR